MRLFGISIFLMQKENQTYNQTVEMPVLSSDKIAGVDIVLESITGLDEETHGLLLSVAPDGKSFSITGTPSLESFRKDGATALIYIRANTPLCFYWHRDAVRPSCTGKKSTICHQSRPPKALEGYSCRLGQHV